MVGKGELYGVEVLLGLGGKEVEFFLDDYLLVGVKLGFGVWGEDLHHYYLLVAYVVVDYVAQDFLDELADDFEVLLGLRLFLA